jgi:hypothetical protein
MGGGSYAADGGGGVSRTPEFDFILPLLRSRGSRGRVNSHGGGVSGRGKVANNTSEKFGRGVGERGVGGGGGGGETCDKELPELGEEWITCSVPPPSGGGGAFMRLEGEEVGGWVEGGEKSKGFARGRRCEGGLRVYVTV